MDDVTDETFATQVLASELPVLVDFWAQWCPPCHLLAPVLDQLAAEYDGRVRIVKVDADTNPASISSYGIRSMPTLLLFREGTVIAQSVGAQAKSRLRALLDSALIPAT